MRLFTGLNDSEKANLKKIIAKYSRKREIEAKKEEMLEREKLEQDKETFFRNIEEIIETHRVNNSIKAVISFKQIKEDKYEIGGRIVSIFLQGGEYKIFETGKFVTLKNFLELYYPNPSKIRKSSVGAPRKNNSNSTRSNEKNPIKPLSISTTTKTKTKY